MGINSMLNQQIIIASKTGYNAYGRETVTGSTVVQARFQKTNKQLLLPNGSLLTIEAVVYVPSDTVVVVDDKVTYGGVDYKVYGIYTAIDGTGKINHLKLDLCKWKAT